MLLSGISREIETLQVEILISPSVHQHQHVGLRECAEAAQVDQITVASWSAGDVHDLDAGLCGRISGKDCDGERSISSEVITLSMRRRCRRPTRLEDTSIGGKTDGLFCARRMARTERSKRQRSAR